MGSGDGETDREDPDGSSTVDHLAVLGAVAHERPLPFTGQFLKGRHDSHLGHDYAEHTAHFVQSHAERHLHPMGREWTHLLLLPGPIPQSVASLGRKFFFSPFKFFSSSFSPPLFLTWNLSCCWINVLWVFFSSRASCVERWLVTLIGSTRWPWIRITLWGPAPWIRKMRISCTVRIWIHVRLDCRPADRSVDWNLGIFDD